MPDIAQYSQENMPMKDILSEIRKMVSSEAQARYAREKTVAKRELLILRPEARVDLLLQEPEPEIVVEAVSKPPPTPTPKPDPFEAKLKEALGISGPDDLEALIRAIFREEMSRLGD